MSVTINNGIYNEPASEVRYEVGIPVHDMPYPHPPHPPYPPYPPIQGPQGLQGANGYQGIQGYRGIQGYHGHIGVQGPQGAIGAGLKIKDVLNGTDELPSPESSKLGDSYVIEDDVYVFYGVGNGDEGTPQKAWKNIGQFNAIQGVQGAEGHDGVQGAIGIQGIQGPAGSGAQGEMGIQGLQGALGIQGIQGAIGAGAQGEMGIQGIQGYQGIPGSGLQGIQGYQGQIGIQGAAGYIQGLEPASTDQIGGITLGQAYELADDNSLIYKGYRFEVTSNPMTINHNLNCYPIVSFYSTVDGEVISFVPSVTYLDENNLIIEYNGEFESPYVILK